MEGHSLHVVVIGGGLGGLCLAQGLKKAGISVAVYERDRTPNDRLQGYRIHIDPQGNQALAACLPADLLTTYLASVGTAGNGFRMATEQLESLLFFSAPDMATEPDPIKRSLSVSRMRLRQILLSGLDDVVTFGKSFTHYQEQPDGKVTAFFDDGTSATGHLLVAADGGNSRVRKQFLPQATRKDTGVLAIMGKLALTDDVKALLLPGRLDGATSILGPHGHAMFLATMERGNQSMQSELDDQGLLYDDVSDYLFWGFIARREKYPAPERMQQMTGAELQQVVTSMTEDWHPHVRQLIRASDPSTIICKPFHGAVPLKHWQTRPITLLGDAIHSMPPTRGIGGNTALRDAETLCRQLIAVHAGQKPLLQALHDYEVEMLKYGFAAVRGSMQALRLHVAERRGVTRLMLRSVDALTRVVDFGKGLFAGRKGAKIFLTS